MLSAKIIDFFNSRKLNQIDLSHGSSELTFEKDDYIVMVLLPKRIGAIEVRKKMKLICLFRKIAFVKILPRDLEELFSAVDDWLAGDLTSKDFYEKYHSVEIMPGISFLEKDVKSYIKWRWRNMIAGPNRIDMLGYRQVYELFKESALSKLYPVFHSFEGLSLSTSIDGKIVYPSIIVDDGKYIIRMTKEGKEILYIESSFDELYETYRALLPQDIGWATFPVD